MSGKINYFILLLLALLAACKKEDSNKNLRSFVKTISTENEMAAVSCFPTNDNNYMIVGRSMNNTELGWIIKTNTKGEEIWRKQVAEFNKVLWNAIPLSGGGFLTVGYEQISQFRFNYIRYDNDGNTIAADTIHIPWACNGSTPADVIQLTNGNFVFALGTSGSKGFIIVADNSLNVLHTQIYAEPDTGYMGCSFHGLTQLNDSTLGLTATSVKRLGTTSAYTNSFLITTDMNGIMRTRTLLANTQESETTNFLGISGNDIISITSSMVGWNTGQGVYVNYLSSSVAENISGRINLIHYDQNGDYKRRDKISSYPQNGMINKGTRTHDGGFILCGTVNQGNSVTVDANTQIYLLKLDAINNMQWSRVINTIYPSFGTDVFETKEGDYFLTGHQNINNKIFNIIIIKTDANGNM